MDEKEDRLTVRVEVNSIDSSILTIKAWSDKYEYETKRALFFFSRLRLPYTINAMQKEYNKIKHHLQLKGE